MTDQNSKNLIWRNVVLVVVTSLFAFLGSLGGSYYKYVKDREQEKYSNMTDFHYKTAELFNQAECLLGSLIAKYDFERVQQGNFPTEELECYNMIIRDINSQLMKLFLIMPDESYKNVSEAIATEPTELANLRNNVLCELRRFHCPDTKIAIPNSVRFIQYHTKKTEQPNQGLEHTGVPPATQP